MHGCVFSYGCRVRYWKDRSHVCESQHSLAAVALPESGLRCSSAGVAGTRTERPEKHRIAGILPHPHPLLSSSTDYRFACFFVSGRKLYLQDHGT